MMDIFYFDTKVKKAKISDLPKIKNKRIWIDIYKINQNEINTIKKIFKLHPLTVEDIQTTDTRIKVEEFKDYMFCVFYGIRKYKDIELNELDFVVGKNFIITNHHKDIKSYNDLKKDRKVLERLLSRGVDFLFHRLLDAEIDNYEVVTQDIDETIDDLEEEATKTATSELRAQILDVKRTIVDIKRSVFSQRQKIGLLTRNEYNFISKEILPYFRDVYDHAIRVSDNIENQREAISNTFDVYMSTVSNNMNEVMKILSIIATIALPLTVISGIYGTNFANLPGENYYYGFWVMIGIMILMAASMIIYFKRRGWF